MRTTDRQASYSIVPFGDFRQLFLVVLPDEPFLCSGDDTQGHGQTVADWPRQVRSLLKSVKSVLDKERFQDDVLMANFFLADIGKKELVRQLIGELLPGGLGAVTFVPQSPADGFALAVEVWALADGEDGRHRILREVPLPGRIVTVEMNGVRWFFAGDLRPGALPVGSYARSLDTFHRLGDQLTQNRFSVDRLVRTWIYQGHLVLPEGDTQRYKELNRARTDFFHGVDFLKDYLTPEYRGDVYPASTGIGADDVDVVIGAAAVSSDRNDLIAVPLENPNQTSAFDYGKAYSPQSPKFARAMAVAVDGACLVFVSGTASITASESRHPDDPEKQTGLTLDNIAALIDGENLERHGVRGFESSLANMECVRVYVKRPDDMKIVRDVCRKRLGDVPVLYTIADVCRPELLVEIEGFAVCDRR